jgi:hypothetical protein
MPSGKLEVRQAGFIPVTVSDKFTRIVDVMLIPEDPGFRFVNGRWDRVSGVYPFLGNSTESAAAARRYDQFRDQQEQSLACLLNITEAIRQIQLSQGSPLTYIKRFIWSGDYGKNGEYDPNQDRFFAWCDPAPINQVKIAADKGLFALELNPGTFHAGATSSWKQIQFGEPNVQLTFHENDHMDVDGWIASWWNRTSTTTKIWERTRFTRWFRTPSLIRSLIQPMCTCCAGWQAVKQACLN